MMFRGLRLALALALCAQVWFGIDPMAAQGQGTPKQGGTIVIVHLLPQQINPLLDINYPMQRLLWLGLTDYNEQGNLVPGLATRWDVSKDGLTYTFALRRDVKWHDGRPFTAGDVKFTIEKILDPKVGSHLRSFFEAIGQVDTPDDYTVVLRLRTPSGTLLDHLWRGILPRHIWEKEEFQKSAYNATPVGTGPFKFKEWVRGDRITLVANPDYFRGRPYLETVVLKEVRDTNVAFAALERGDVDLFPAWNVVGTAPYHLLKGMEAKGNLEIHVSDSSAAQYLYFTVDKAPLDNLKVRQAIAHALNRPELAERMTAGYGKVLDAWINPRLTWAHNRDVKSYRYDVAEANRLLDEAGVRRGAGGVRFKTRIYATSGPRVVMSELIQAQLRAVGIDSEIVTSDWNTYINTIQHKRTAEGIFSFFHLSTIPDPEWILNPLWGREVRPGGRGYSKYVNPKLDELMDQMVRTTDRTERGRLAREIQTIIAADVPGIPLFTQPDVNVWNKKFKGLHPLVWAGGPLTFVEKAWQE